MQWQQLHMNDIKRWGASLSVTSIAYDQVRIEVPGELRNMYYSPRDVIISIPLLVLLP